MEDCIYFAIGFKSFDIERISDTAGEWYEWTERSRRVITRTSFSKRSMIWITQILQEASKEKGNSVRRWKKTESLSEIFCARNFNKHGRYFSLINIRGRRRSVIIIPELSFNSGWDIFADKIGSFLARHRVEENRMKQRLVDSNVSFAEAVRSFKWSNSKGDGVNVRATLMKEKDQEIIRINDAPNTHNEVLQRSLVGSFEGRDMTVPTLSEVRGWTNKNWRQTHGLNTYEMGGGKFLFEFATRDTAEQVIAGDWVWCNTKVRLDWWTPTIVASNRENGSSSTWIRIVGLPLHLWSQTIFKSIGDFCGGWVETEEETQLRNHLKWARIRVEGDGSRIPKEVTILNAGISFSMQLWTELPARYVVGEESESPPIIQQFSRNYPVANRRTDGAASFKTRGVAVKDKGPGPTSNSNLMANLGRFSPLLNQGPKHNQHHKQPDLTDNTKKPKSLNDFSRERGMKGEKDLREIKDLASKFLQAFKNWEKEAEVEEDTMGQKEGDAKNVSNQETTRNQECSKTRKESEIRTTNIMQEAEQNLQIQQIHEVDPVNIQFPSSQEIIETEASNWVNSHILELSNTYGVAFEGFEKETITLLMKIDERKSMLDNKGSGKAVSTPKSRIGKNELKNLKSSLNEEVEGSRSRGKNLSLTFK